MTVPETIHLFFAISFNSYKPPHQKKKQKKTGGQTALIDDNTIMLQVVISYIIQLARIE